jgi:hypothetical protein
MMVRCKLQLICKQPRLTITVEGHNMDIFNETTSLSHIWRICIRAALRALQGYVRCEARPDLVCI